MLSLAWGCGTSPARSRQSPGGLFGLWGTGTRQKSTRLPSIGHAGTPLSHPTAPGLGSHMLSLFSNPALALGALPHRELPHG